MFINIIKCSQTFSTVNFERCEITLWYMTGTLFIKVVLRSMLKRCMWKGFQSCSMTGGMTAGDGVLKIGDLQEGGEVQNSESS